MDLCSGQKYSSLHPVFQPQGAENRLCSEPGKHVNVFLCAHFSQHSEFTLCCCFHSEGPGSAAGSVSGSGWKLSILWPWSFGPDPTPQPRAENYHWQHVLSCHARCSTTGKTWIFDMSLAACLGHSVSVKAELIFWCLDYRTGKEQMHLSDVWSGYPSNTGPKSWIRYDDYGLMMVGAIYCSSVLFSSAAASRRANVVWRKQSTAVWRHFSRFHQQHIGVCLQTLS